MSRQSFDHHLLWRRRGARSGEQLLSRAVCRQRSRQAGSILVRRRGCRRFIISGWPCQRHRAAALLTRLRAESTGRQSTNQPSCPSQRRCGAQTPMSTDFWAGPGCITAWVSLSKMLLLPNFRIFCDPRIVTEFTPKDKGRHFNAGHRGGVC